MLSLGRSSVGPGGVTRLQATPTPASRMGPRASAPTPHHPLPPPVPPLDSRYASQAVSSASKLRKAAALSIGDLGAGVQVVDGNEQGYRGVLRYLGAIQGKGQAIFAGIELLDEWQGLGKNDGTVAGVQYFATAPKCGMFLVPSRLRKLSQEAPTDAVARPQSAMSGQGSQASEHDSLDRPTSTTPARRRVSAVSSSIARPGSSTAALRSVSRASTRPESAMSSTRPASRTALAPRKTATEDESAARRAKTSAEQVAAAQSRIKPGSRAAQLMTMKAKDLAARKRGAALRDGDETALGDDVSGLLTLKPKTVSSALSNPDSDSSSPSSRLSPLKDALTNKIALGDGRSARFSPGPSTPGMLPKPRKSFVDPRTAAGHTPFRPSVALKRPPAVSSEPVFAQYDATSPFLSPAGDAMPPPLSTSAASASRHQRSTSHVGPATPSRFESVHGRSASGLSHRGSNSSRVGSSLSCGVEPAAHQSRSPNDSVDSPVCVGAQKARSLALLEQMDLDATPKKQEAATAAPRASSRASYVSISTRMVEGDDVAEAVVALSIYEEVYNELSSKTSALHALQQSHDALVLRAKVMEEDLVAERKRLRAEQEQFKKLIEEERETEREDEKRRRRDLESKEREARSELDSVKRELQKSLEDAAKRQSDNGKEKDEFNIRLVESAALVDELKKALAIRDDKSNTDGDAAKVDLSSQLQAKDAELEQLSSRLTRLESQWVVEKADLDKEIDELKEAGQETISLYELRLIETDQESRLAIEELEDQIQVLQSKAQAAIAELERYKKASETSPAERNGAIPGSAAAIDQESLREQLAHAQDKLLATEDQLAETATALEAERDLSRRRKDKAQEAELRWKTEVKKLKGEIEKLAGDVRDARDKHEELAEALKERGAALESERAELEVLRAEASGHVDLTSAGELLSAATISKLKAEVDQLSVLLEGARSGKREASRKVEELERQLGAATAKVASSLEPQSYTMASRSPQAGEPFDLSPDAKRFSPTSNSSLGSPNSARLRDSFDPATAKSKEMTGLRNIINALSEENAILRTQLKEGSNGVPVPREEGNEMDDLRRHLATANSQQAALQRKNQELAREVSDLEALVEAGMWAKEELEAKLEDCERKITNLAASKDGLGASRGGKDVAPTSVLRPPSTNVTGNRAESVAKDAAQPPPDDGGESVSSRRTAETTFNAEEGDVCDDCGSKDHTLENCPLLDEIF